MTLGETIVDRFAKIRELDERWAPEIDELALILAYEMKDAISQALSLELTHQEWQRLRTILQAKIAMAIRHTRFGPPPFPGRAV